MRCMVAYRTAIGRACYDATMNREYKEGEWFCAKALNFFDEARQLSSADDASAQLTRLGRRWDRDF